MDYCKNVSIIINIPLSLNEETLTLYDSLSKSGYNLFDANDSFYTDICTEYTSENGTDVFLNVILLILIFLYAKVAAILNYIILHLKK